MNFIKWIAYVLMLGLFIWFVFFRDFNFNSEADQISIPESTTENFEVEEIPLVDDTFFIDQSIDETENYSETSNEYTTEEFDETDPIEEVTPITANGFSLNKKYLIVIGSFENRAYADIMLKRIIDSGKEGKIEKIRGLNRVVVASSDDQDDAQNLRDHFIHTYKEIAFILER